MNRERIVQALLQNMEVVGKAMMSRKIEALQTNLPTHSQLGVLLLVNYQGSHSIKDLAQKFRMTPSAATQLVNGLVTSGLLVRVEDGKDRRKISVEITQKGKRVLEATKKQREKNMLKIFEPLSDTELAQLEKIQRKITEHLQILWTKNQL